MLFKPPSRAFAKFFDTPVLFKGKRAEGRELTQPVWCMVIEEAISPLSDAVAPTQERIFDISFPATNWWDKTPPQIGEWVSFAWGEDKPVSMWAKVDTVGHMPNGNYSLTASWSPELKEGPPWLA